MSIYLNRRRLDNPAAFDSALAGDLPAEALTPYDRRVLVDLLYRRGYSDQQIAAHTRWTLYTAARIRADLYSEPNPHIEPQVLIA